MQRGCRQANCHTSYLRHRLAGRLSSVFGRGLRCVLVKSGKEYRNSSCSTASRNDWSFRFASVQKFSHRAFLAVGFVATH
jgi:hypothetical protein